MTEPKVAIDRSWWLTLALVVVLAAGSAGYHLWRSQAVASQTLTVQSQLLQRYLQDTLQASTPIETVARGARFRLLVQQALLNSPMLSRVELQGMSGESLLARGESAQGPPTLRLAIVDRFAPRAELRLWHHPLEQQMGAQSYAALGGLFGLLVIALAWRLRRSHGPGQQSLLWGAALTLVLLNGFYSWQQRQVQQQLVIDDLSQRLVQLQAGDIRLLTGLESILDEARERLTGIDSLQLTRNASVLAASGTPQPEDIVHQRQLAGSELGLSWHYDPRGYFASLFSSQWPLVLVLLLASLLLQRSYRLKMDAGFKRPGWRSLLAQGVVTSLSLLLLAYVGYGETLRTTEKIEKAQIESQAQLAQTRIESALKAGIPLTDLANLDALLRPTLLELSSVVGVRVSHSSGQRVYPPLGMALNDHGSLLELPLQGRIGQQGRIEIWFAPDRIEQSVQSLFKPIALVIVLLALISFALPRWMTRPDVSLAQAERRYFALAFSLVALMLLVIMSGLYARSAQNQGEYLAQSLQQRISAATSSGVPLSLLSGLDQLLVEYKALNPQISQLDLSEGGQVLFSADAERKGQMLEIAPFQILHQQQIANAFTTLTLTLPVSTILEQVARALKNFAVLFIATWLAANLFSRLLARRSDPALSPQSRTLETLNPIFFLAIIMESLHNAFLPGLLKDTAAMAQLGDSASSLLFMVFFVAFALTLLPAGHLAERYGARRMLLLGAVLATIGASLLMLDTSLHTIITARALAGLGQCMLLVSVQQLILANTDDSNRTRGAAIIVTNFNASFISGTALGSLLINYLGPQGVFGIEAAVGLALISLVMILLPFVPPAVQNANGSSMRTVFADCYRLLRFRPFRHAMVWVGLPTKATLTGIITFVLPLVLAEIGFVSEDIGQVIMLYAVGVLVASRYLSAWVDKVGQPGRVIGLASWVAVTAMLLLVIGQWSLASLQAWWGYGIIVLSVLLLGFAHGGINAPIVSHMLHVVPDETASRQTTVTSYRFLERIGHVMGPFVCGQILVWLGYGTESLIVLGALLFIAALWYSLGAVSRKVEA